MQTMVRRRIGLLLLCERLPVCGSTSVKQAPCRPNYAWKNDQRRRRRDTQWSGCEKRNNTLFRQSKSHIGISAFGSQLPTAAGNDNVLTALGYERCRRGI